MRLQISLDFIIAFSFVMVIFTLMFGVIASQRGVLSNQQTFSQLQLIAQDIASQINQAVQAGNGYSAQVTLPQGILPSTYNVTVTGAGLVVVSLQVNKQNITTTAYTMVNHLYSSPSYITTKNPGAYVLPVANGTIQVQNSFGNICIDYACPNLAPLASNIRVSSTTTQVANFGGNSLILMQPNPFTIGGVSVAAWIKPGVQAPASPDGNAYHPVAESGLDPGSCSTTTGYYTLIGGVGTTSEFIFCVTLKVGAKYTTYSTPAYTAVNNNQWYYVTGVYNNGAGTLLLYVNGQPVESTSGVTGTVTTTGYISVGGSCDTASCSPPSIQTFNGSVANLQFFNTGLSSAVVNTLYQGGIASEPVQRQYHAQGSLMGWWPLDGSAADYDGNGDPGNNIGPVQYYTTADVTAFVTNSSGALLQGDLVGFMTTTGNFTNGREETSGITNPNGSVSAFISGGGYATVKAVAFEGNLSTESKLVGWWPLDTDQGSMAYDLSNYGDSGQLVSSFWDSPSYAASFDGKSGLVDIPSLSINPSGALTFSLWFKATGGGVLASVSKVTQPGASTSNTPFLFVSSNGMLYAGYWSGGAAYSFPTGYFVEDSKWHNVIYTTAYGGSSGKQDIFIDGNPLSTVTGSSPGYSPAYLTIGEGQTSGWLSNANNYFNGSISNFQVYSTGFGSGSAQRLYDEGASGIPLPGSGLTAWLPLDSDALDYSGNGYNGIMIGGASFAAANYTTAKISRILSGNFMGTGLVSAVANQINTVSGQNNTVTFWVNMKPYTGASGAEMFGFNNQYGVSLTSSCLGIFSQSPTTVWGESIPTQLLGNWTFVAARLYNGDPSRSSLYLNGANQTLTQCTGSHAAASASANVAMGSGFSGQMADIQVYNTSLSSPQIQSIYKEGIAGFPLYTRNIAAWWPLDGSANDFGPNGNQATFTNAYYVTGTITASQLSYSRQGFGNSYSGSTSHVTTSSNSLGLGGGSLTVSAWVLPLASNQNAYIVSQAPFHTNWQMYLHNGYLGFSGGADSQSVSTTTQLPVGVWSYVVGIIKGSTGSIYVNGVNVSSGTVTAIGAGTGGMNMGWSGSGQYFNGSIANIEIYSGTLTATQVYQLYNDQMPKAVSYGVPLTGWAP